MREQPALQSSVGARRDREVNDSSRVPQERTRTAKTATQEISRVRGAFGSGNHDRTQVASSQRIPPHSRRQLGPGSSPSRGRSRPPGCLPSPLGPPDPTARHDFTELPEDGMESPNRSHHLQHGYCFLAIVDPSFHYLTLDVSTKAGQLHHGPSSASPATHRSSPPPHPRPEPLPGHRSPAGSRAAPRSPATCRPH